MCTSIVYKTKDAYFGRNLDLEYSYNETITISPRKFPFHFRAAETIESHYAIIGVAYVVPDQQKQDYPLYYDAINEKGLGISGLLFAGNAFYFKKIEDKDNIAPFEFIPWVLSQCANVEEAKQLISKMNFYNESFSAELPLSELHWLVADDTSSITVESTRNGLQIYENPIDVLTNNPPFPAQLFNLNNYAELNPADPKNTFAPTLRLSKYSHGLGTHNLPGGMDSQSRFIRAAFTKMHAKSEEDELSSISQYFHILENVAQPRGTNEVAKGEYEITVYSSGYNLNKGICYYTCYDNHQISAIDMHQVKLDSKKLISYPMINTEQINYQNIKSRRIRHI